MNVLLTVLFVCSILSPLTSAQEGGDYYYSRRYDNIDINNIFRSRLLNHYVDCLLDKKPCPPEGKDLKRVLPDALRTRCARCTKVQKTKALDVITRLYYQHPSIYTALAERYDPTGEYTRNFENWFDEQNAVKPRPPLPQDINPDAPDDVKIVKKSDQPARPSPSTQQSVRRSPSESVLRDTPNEVPTERTRIPSTWITVPTKPSTTQSSTSTRAPLRTTASTSTNRPILKDSPVASGNTFRASTSTTSRPVQPSFQLDLFAPYPNGSITRSINKLLDTTEKVVNGVVSNVAGMFRSTIEIITGTG